MKDVKILGTGCPKCQKLAEATASAADELGIEYQIEKVKEINEIMKYGVMITPALVIDGEVKVAGKIPPAEELKAMLGA